MNTKKSSLFFLPIIVIVSLAVLVYLYIVLLDKNSYEIPIGKRQFDLLRTYMKAESTLFYIDQSAKYALQQAVYELAQNGGISEYDIDDIFVEHECGKFNDAYVWYTLEKENNNIKKIECFDESLALTNLEYFFNKNLKQYLLNYPHNIPFNYDYEINDGLEVIGKAKAPLKFDILRDETKQIVKKPIEIAGDTVDYTGSEKNLVDFTDADLCANGQTCLLTEEAYKLLEDAEKIAQENEDIIKENNGKKVSLVVNSGYRSEKEQRRIWLKKAKDYPNPEIRKKYVCNPDVSDDCPHTTGKAVDVVFEGKTTKKMSNKDWLLLNKVMSKAGWIRYGDVKRPDVGEKWHFECCGTARYTKAKEKGETAAT